MEYPAETSPQVYARTAGWLYLAVIILGIFTLSVVRSTVLVTGDPAATAANLHTHELLYRLGFVAHLILLLCNVPLALCFYKLLKVVNRSLALLVVFFILMGTAIESFSLLANYAPLVMLASGHLANGFAPKQLQALAYTSLQLEDIALLISFVFFGVDCFTTGYLIFKSGFLPRFVGVLQATAGLCYLTNSFANFLAPAFADHLFPYIMLPCLVGEGTLTVWFLVQGVDMKRWEARHLAKTLLLHQGFSI